RKVWLVANSKTNRFPTAVDNGKVRSNSKNCEVGFAMDATALAPAEITKKLECATGSCGRMPSIRSCRAGESTRNSAILLFLLQIASAPGSTHQPRVNCGLSPSDA